MLDEPMLDVPTLRQAGQDHADAVKAMDLDRVRADLIPELHDQMAGLASILPDPLEAAIVESATVHDGYGETITAYAGAGTTLRVKARWEDRGAGRLQIVDGGPAPG